MAQNNQISSCYKNKELAELLSVITMIGMVCPMEHVLYSGSIHLSLSSLFKLFGSKWVIMNFSISNKPCSWHIGI